jgi:N-acyl-D-amino-acid deacylase
MGAEIVIKGGTVYDGTGAPGVVADVAVSGGRIVEVGTGLSGDRVLDASGHAVAPGFVDIHTHYDAQVFWDPALTPSCFHGVTTVVAGNCGFSIAPTRPEDRELIAKTLEKVEDMDVAALAAGIPWDFETFPEYLASIERRGTVLNYAAYIGHTPLRMYVMRDAASDRVATADEVTEMARLVTEAMNAGAAGFATSFAMTHRGADGRPIPSRYADRTEYETLFKAVGATRRGVVEVTPGENLSIAGMYDLQPSIGAPMTYTALLTSPNGSHLNNLKLNREGWANGAQVWPQVTCRPLNFSMHMGEPFTLNPNAEFAALMGASVEARATAYADPAWRARVKDIWAGMVGMVPRFDTYEILETQAHPALVGKKLSAIAAEMGKDPFDALLDLALQEPDLKLRVKVIVANDDVDGVRQLLSDPGCTLGLSDAGAHVGQLCDAPMPTDLLGNWVREREVLSLETAIHKLTGVPAQLFGFADRGALKPGYAADITVFDPATVAPGPIRRVRDFPAGTERLTADAPTGMRHVLVNGTPIQVDGTQLPDVLGTRPGQLVKPAARG